MTDKRWAWSYVGHIKEKKNILYRAMNEKDKSLKQVPHLFLLLSYIPYVE